MTTQFKARPTIYNGIRMRSRLEAGYAAWLDRWEFDWEYEPCAFSDDTGRQYLPDFRLNGVRVAWSTEPQTAYVEVKPSLDLEPFLDMMNALAMEVILASDPDAILLLAHPDSEDLQDDPGRWLEVGIMEPISVVQMFWPVVGLWTTGRRGLWERRGQPLTLARPVSAKDGPWYGEWWKGIPR